MVKIHSDPDAEEIVAHSHDDIDHVLMETNESDTGAKDLHKRLATRQREWNCESDRVGFAAVVQQEGQVWVRERHVANTIFRTSAKNFIGVQIKLALMMQMDVDGTGDVMSPLSQLQSIFNDLASLIKA
jgi:hypothetical protein